MIAARPLLRDAAALRDAHPRLLRAAGPVRSFHDGARWMRLAMRTVRGRRVPWIKRSLERVGWRKYATCGGLTLAFAALMIGLRVSWLLPLCVPCFYLLEVRRVFDVPLAIDGQSPLDNHALLASSGGVVRRVFTVMTLAAVMCFGGLAGRGFVRSWCLGCAAVVIWYERVRDDRMRTKPRVCTSGRTLRAKARLPARRWIYRLALRFEFGASLPLSLRRERVSMPIARPVRLLYASDLHLGNRWSPRVVDELLRHVEIEKPEALLLGGDLADSHAGLAPLRRLLAAACRVTTVAAVLGNHDRRWSRGEGVRAALVAAGVVLLDETSLDVGTLRIVGPRGAVADAARTVVCAHDPVDYRRDARLTLAGHLHGGQCVLWNRGPQQWPGWLINRHTLLRRDDDASKLIVSRGAADTLPVRFNCPREVVVVEIDPAAQRPA